MTIPEAIEANEDTVELLTEKGLIRKAKAIKLGIEALKHYRAEKQEGSLFKAFLLPGETEE